MGTAERRERERNEREELILDQAERLLLERGYQGWNMDELAQAVEYSKGTLYLHFKTKEDLLVALSSRALRLRGDLFERALQFKGRSRERIRAIGVADALFVREIPNCFEIQQLLKQASFWDRASNERRELHVMQAGRCFNALLTIVQEGIESGDLPQLKIPPEQAAFAIIGVTVGSHLMSRHHDLRTLSKIDDSFKIVRQNQDLVLDGLGWRALSKDWNYHDTDCRIRKEIFPEAELPE